MNITHKDGNLGEFQIRGELINDFGEIEHSIYDSLSGKNVEAKFLGVKNALNSLTDSEKNKYFDYISDLFTYFRKIESSKESKIPELPKGLPEILEYNSLKAIYNA